MLTAFVRMVGEYGTRGRIHQLLFRTFSSYSPDFFLFSEAFECNTTSDWLNQSEVVLHSNL